MATDLRLLPVMRSTTPRLKNRYDLSTKPVGDKKKETKPQYKVKIAHSKKENLLSR